MESPEKPRIGVLFSAIFLWCALPAGGQTQLPEGKGKEIVESVCASCHGLERATNPRRTREEWRNVISDMVSRGAPLMVDEFEIVAQYLAKHFGAEKPSGSAAKTSTQGKVNVNKAAAEEMEAALGLSAQEADAVVRHREKNGDFSKWEDLKKVPGWDGKRIEGIKDRLAF